MWETVGPRAGDAKAPRRTRNRAMMRGTVVGTSRALATACVVLSQGGNSVRSNRSKKRPNELRSRPAATYQGVSRVTSGSERERPPCVTDR